MVIELKDKLINRLMTCVYLEKDDPSVLHLVMDQAFLILKDHGFAVPGKQFEILVNTAVNEQFVNKMPAEPKLTKFLVAELIYNIAMQLVVKNELIPERDKRFLKDKNADRPPN